MNSSFYNGVIGTKSHQYSIDVLADNIANVNTIGYKSSTVEFSTIYSTALTDSYFSPTSDDIGLGSRISATTTDISQGIFQNSDNPFDLAIGGDGWFGVSSNNQTFYTRNGNFNIDSNGYLVDNDGNYLLGTSGNNITSTILSQDKLEKFGTYYSTNGSILGNAFAISDIDDISLSDIKSQSKINLPDILYYPPVPTTNISFSANLNPKTVIDTTQIDINSSDFTYDIDTTNQTLSINGTVSNTTDISNPQPGNAVLLTISDSNGNSIDFISSLDENLTWSINNIDISMLDPNTLSIDAKLQTTQEIPNIEHFSSTIISPNGDKDILDMTFTHRIDNESTGNTWDGTIQILSYFEDYIAEQYNPNQTYDPEIYNIEDGMVTKIYDPQLYKVDTTTNKVYKIIDSQNTTLNFGSSGELLTSDIPTLNNQGTTINLDFGNENDYNGFVSSERFDKTTSETHNGSIEGFLMKYGMDSQGNVIAQFDNGKTVPIAKIGVYHFQNDQGLERVNSTLFSQTSNSGNPIFFTNENGENILGAKIYSNTLESSNVQLTTALTELIILQKAYDANAKSITTSDQMIQNAINMKK